MATINVTSIQHLKYKKYKTGHALSGLCYILTEAYYYYNGRKGTPHHINWEGVSHWYLVVDNKVIDLTSTQFKERPDYTQGRGQGFLTKHPSKRAREILIRYYEVFEQ